LAYLAGRGVPASGLLGVHQLSVDRYLEDATRGLNQTNVDARVRLVQLSRQTGGSGMIVSNYAVLNRDLHRNALRENALNRRES
jgi:hypothetical protein